MMFGLRRLELYEGDCLDLMAQMPSGLIDAVVTDPPYGLAFMGKDWDHGVPGAPFWKEALRVAKPGAHLVAFGGTRTYHRLACALEDAGFEIRDCLSWLYGSGFPKSLDVSKAIDRGYRRDEVGQEYEWRPTNGPAAEVYAVTAFVRAARDRAGKTNREVDALFGFNGMSGHWTSSTSQPSIPTWPQWERLKAFLAFGEEMDAQVLALNGGKGDRSIEGTALAEREVLGRARGKDAVGGELYAPGGGTYIPNEYDITKPATAAAAAWEGWGTALKPAWEPIILARRPVVGTIAQNVLSHGTGALNIGGCKIGTAPLAPAVRGVSQLGTFEGADGNVTPERTGRWPANLVLDEEAARQLDEESGQVGGSFGTRGRDDGGSSITLGDRPTLGQLVGFGDAGGASRFFYTAKASAGERHYAGRNAHPTVKPVDLMQWLCRLVTPKGGLVLDPFMGSGSTGIAALAEGFRFLGIEKEAEYLETARRRIAGPLFAGEEAGA